MARLFSAFSVLRLNLKSGGGVADHGAFRSRRITLSFLTSIASKVVSTVLQLAIIPLAIRALGTDRFGVYAALAATMGWVNMAGIGIGPGLTISMASAVASSNDRQKEGRLFSTAFFLIFALTVAMLVALFIVVHVLGIPMIFGPKLLAYEAEIRQGLTVLAFLLGANLILSVVGAAQSGYQSQYLNNLWMIVGNLLTIGMILLVVFAWRSITGMILAAYGTITVAKLLNGGQLLLRRPYLIPRLNRVDRVVAKLLAGVGVAFLLGQFASFLYQQFSIYWVGRQLGPGNAATFAVMTQILTLAGGMVVMITVPLWPAIADAKARNDWNWISAAYNKVTLGLMAYAAVVGLIIATGGNFIVRHWIGSQVAPSVSLQFFIGVYFVLVVWEHMHYAILIGLGNVRRASIGFLFGAIVMIASSLGLVNIFGIAGMALSLCLGPLLVTSWVFPIMVRKSLAIRDKRMA